MEFSIREAGVIVAGPEHNLCSKFCHLPDCNPENCFASGITAMLLVKHLRFGKQLSKWRLHEMLEYRTFPAGSSTICHHKGRPKILCSTLTDIPHQDHLEFGDDFSIGFRKEYHRLQTSLRKLESDSVSEPHSVPGKNSHHHSFQPHQPRSPTPQISVSGILPRHPQHCFINQHTDRTAIVLSIEVIIDSVVQDAVVELR
jgi:hypothetical protein